MFVVKAWFIYLLFGFGTGQSQWLLWDFFLYAQEQFLIRKNERQKLQNQSHILQSK